MKRFIIFLLTFFILFPISSPANAANITDFSDVNSDAWYYDCVKFVTDNKMFEGTSSNTFSPSGTMTRAMFVTVLGRYSGVQEEPISEDDGIITKSDVRMRDNPSTKSGTSNVIATYQKNTHVTIIENVPDDYDENYTWYYVSVNGKTGYIRDDLMEPNKIDFTDIELDSWYTSYVLWACNNGIAEPTSETTFSPNVEITREEICSMLYNFSAYKHYMTKPQKDKINFTDCASINPKYTDAVTTVQQLGVIDGYPDGTFRPTNNAARSEVSAMLMRYIDATSYKPIIEDAIDQYGNYIFGTEVPTTSAVSKSYFDDACFIGHSLVVGMENCFNIPNADFYAINSATTNAFIDDSSEAFTLPNGELDEDGDPMKGNLNDALSCKQYGKVYIMLGINEASNSTYARNNFYNNMLQLISLVRKSQPDAPIFLISLTPVTEELSDENYHFNRDNVIEYNKMTKTICHDTFTFYLNSFDLLANSNGYLPSTSSLAGDGIHILQPQYQQLYYYITTHTSTK